MREHRTEKMQERISQPLAESRSDGERLIGLDETPVSTQSDRFIQIDTEHGVGRFKSAHGPCRFWFFQRRVGIANLVTRSRREEETM